MKLNRALLIAAASLFAGSSAGAAVPPAPDTECAAMVTLLRQARSDFASLRQKKMDPGTCTFRDTQYSCAWHFPGDRYDASDAQAARLTHCLADYPAAQPIKAKGKDSAFAVDPYLTVLVPAPELDGDGWNVTLTIRSSWKGN